MIEYDQYFYRHGIRKYEFLTNPPLTPLMNFELPFYSLVHYLPQTSVEIGPKFGEVWFQSAGGLRYVDHVLEQATNEGNPIWAKQTPTTFVQNFRKKEKDFRRMGPLEQITTARTALVIVNYSILQHLWTYRDTFMTPYYRWVNIRNTLWQNVARLAKVVPQENQFIVMQMPKAIPSLADFRLAAEKHTRATMLKFGADDYLDLLDLFIWAGPNREASVLSALDEKALDRANIIFTVGGFWTIVNLGVLNQWIKGEGVGTERDIEKGKDAKAMQKQLLAFFNRLMTSQSTAGTDFTPREHVTDLPDAAETVAAVQSVSRTIQANSDSVSGLGLKIPDIPEIPDLDFDLDDDQTNSANADTPAVNAIRLKNLETGDNIIRTFWDLDRPPMDINEIIQPIVSEVTEAHGDTLGQYDLGVLEMAAKYHSEGRLTNAEFSRFEKASGKYRELQFDEKRTVAEACVIEESTLKDVESFKLPNIKTVLDKTMLKSTLTVFDRNYIEKVLDSDIANMFMSPQRAGFALTAFSKDRTETVMDKLDTITVAYTAVDGERTVLKIPVPVIEPEGTFKMNNVRYYLKKQRVDMPIRKVAPNKVSLTSYYGKTFIWRSDKVRDDYGAWLLREVGVGVKQNDSKYTHVMYGQGATNTDHAPRVFTTLASTYVSFNYGDYEFNLNYKDRDKYPAELVDRPAELYPLGFVTIEGKRVPFTVDRQGMVYRGDTDAPLGTIEEILNLKAVNAPMDVAELALFGKRIPMALVLTYHYGIDELLSRLDVKPDVREPGERLKLNPGEYSIRFKDQVLVLKRDNRLAAIILAGFNNVSDAVSNYDYNDFNTPDAVLNVMDSSGISARYLREVDNQFLLFLDHITRGLLADMKEPTEFGPLLVRACQLLLTDNCPDETDMNFMRLAGYERVAGAVYRELSRAIRTQRNRQSGRRGPIELRPDAIMRRIQSDGSGQIVEDSTPVHNLKEQEAVTTGGDGGRSSVSMVRSTRAFHETDLGTISEATVDSGAVAINTSLVANPKFTSLRGTTSRYEEKDGAASLLSTSALLAPGADRDDPKRVNFISIQNSSGISAEGYETMPVGTGMESVIAHRAGPKFAAAATGDGVVAEINDDAVVIDYDDPALGRQYYRIGLEHGIIAGMTVPHNVTTDLKVDQRVSAGTIVARNKAFFQPDPLQDGQVIYKPAMIVRTVLVDGTDTLEDSSAISLRVSKALTTSVTYPRTITVDEGEVIHNLIEVGAKVDLESILCSVENPITANAGLFDDDSYDSLQELAAASPKAEVAGVVDKIEVFYNGDPDDFNESISRLIRVSDKAIARRKKRMGGSGPENGRVDERSTIDGKRLQPKQAAIVVSITAAYDAQVGDKGVFSHQLKTTFGRVMTGVNESEDGQEIDSIFGYQSISDRIVGSAESMGTTFTLALRLRELVIEAYRN